MSPYDPPCSGCGLNCGGRCFGECEADYDPPEMTHKQLREKYAPDLRLTEETMGDPFLKQPRKAA